jgi:hypothetical protein
MRSKRNINALNFKNFFLCVLCELCVNNQCRRLPAIAVDGPALKHTQIAADGRGGRVA